MEQIGLEAVLKDSKFQAGIKKYQGSVDTANTKTGKFSGALNNLTSKVPGLGSALSLLTNPLTLVVAGVGAFAAIAKKSIGDFVDYNKQIREMSQVTGLSAEETSRIVQVSDDWGISAGEVQSALQMMSRKGVVPSIDNLANLADEYVNAKDKALFLQDATKEYGRSVVTLIPLLAEGGDVLREQTDAVDENLIATKKSIDAARKYEVASDNLGDKITGLRNQLGLALLPAAIAVTDALVDGIDAIGEYSESIKELRRTTETYTDLVKEGKIAEEEYTGKLKGHGKANVSAAAAQYQMNLAIKDYQDSLPVIVEGTDEGKFAYLAMSEAAKALAGDTDGLTGEIDALKSSFDEANLSAGQFKEGLSTISESMVDQERITAVLEIATGKLTGAELLERLEALERLDAMERLNTALGDGTIDHYQWIAAMADGEVTQAEVNALLGIADDELSSIEMHMGKLDGLVSDVTVNVRVNEHRNVGTPGEIPLEQNGGPVSGGNPYIVGEVGPELFVPSSNGVIVPNSALSNYSVSTNNTRNININLGGVNITNGGDHQAFIAQVEYAVRRSLGV